MHIDSTAYAEVIVRLVRLRELLSELAVAYDDPVAKRGSEEMAASLNRVLQLLGHRE